MKCYLMNYILLLKKTINIIEAYYPSLLVLKTFVLFLFWFLYFGFVHLKIFLYLNFNHNQIYIAVSSESLTNVWKYMFSLRV